MSLADNTAKYFAPKTLRKYMAIGGLLCLFSALYASFLPLQFEQKTLSQSLIAFNEIPWFQLGITKRADWFANGLLLVPFGFFFSGALNYGRTNLLWAGFAFGFLVALTTMVVCFIEWGQFFFPPRVRSLNDMLAGFIGGITGIVIWQLLGNLLVTKSKHFFNLPKGIPRIAAATQIALTLMALSSLMPLDIILSFPEMKSKFMEGKINLIPLVDLKDTSSTLVAFIHASWIIPASVVWCINRGKRYAIRQVIFWSILTETLTLPIYGRFFSSTDILLPLASGFLCVRISPLINSRLIVLNRAKAFGLASFLWTLLLLLVLNSRFDTVNLNPEHLRERLNGFLVVPYASAQRSTEFQAMENIVGKAFLFAILGALLERTCYFAMRDAIDEMPAIYHAKYAITVTAVIALLLELSQIALPPLIVESSDVITYSLGGLAGVIAAQVMFAEK